MEFRENLPVQTGTGMMKPFYSLQGANRGRRLASVGICLLFLHHTLTGQDTLQLAPPYLQYNTIFFAKEQKVGVAFRQAGTALHYTLNGGEPTLKDPKYVSPILLRDKYNILKVKAFGEGFKPSETAQATFYKKGRPVKSIRTTPPHERYPGSGPATLIDGKGGINRYDSKTWMGFQQDTVSVEITLKTPAVPNSILVNMLYQQSAWIFPPVRIEAFAWENEWRKLGQIEIDATRNENQAACMAVELKNINPSRLKTQRILLIIKPLKELPDWHPGKGQPAWFFMDEIIVY